MGDILDEAYGIAQCKDCPRYKFCVTPMTFTAEDISSQSDNTRGSWLIWLEELPLEILYSA